MKTVNNELSSYLNSEKNMISCDLFVLQLADGTKCYYTNADKSITYDGVTYSAVYTISKVYPGKDGSDAVSRYLELSCTSVKVDKSGNVSPSKITAKQMKQVGGKAPENTDDLYLVGLAF